MQILFTIRLKMCLFQVKKPMHLVYHVISYDGLGGSIAYHWGSQMASSLSQIRVTCSTRDREEYTGHEKL